MSTTNFDQWMDHYVDPSEYDEILSLYDAVQENSSSYDMLWNVTYKNDQVFIKQGDNGETLALLSGSAIESFLSMLDERYGHGIGVEAWAHSQRAADNTP